MEDRAPGAPRCSVVVPFRNASRTLAICLGSLLGQDHPSFEVIAVDDASQDDGAAIALRFAEAHPGRLVVHRRAERGGAQRARMDGVAMARGDIVAFVDADCEAPPGWLRLVASTLREDEVAIGGAYHVPPGLPLVARFETRSLLDYWYRHMPEDTDHVATGCGAAWRRHLTTEVMASGLAYAGLTSGDDTMMSLALRRRGPLRYVPSFFVYHHTRTSLSGFLSQQLRRGQSRSRISVDHFDAKVKGARDTRMGLLLLQIASAWGALAAAAVLAVAIPSAPAAALAGIALSFVPFAALQVPLIVSAIRARESFLFLLATLPLCFLRNLAWGCGGILGVSRTLFCRARVPQAAA
ncbi:MAG: glycosyltransferase family 2 protein [Acidobacteriota bacterium]